MTVFVQKEQTDVDTYEQDKSDFDSFAAIIRKYLGIRELTLTIANECVRKIIVHAADKPKGYYCLELYQGTGAERREANH